MRTSLEEGRSRGIEDHEWSRISDAEQLATAKGLDRVLFTFDGLNGRDGAQVAAEIQLNGGWIIQVSGGPQQPPYRALAKLLWHYDQWTEFLRDQHGVVLLRDPRQAPVFFTVDEFYNRKVVSIQNRHYFDEYITRWNERELPQTTPRALLTPEEQLLTYPLPEAPPEETGV